MSKIDYEIVVVDANPKRFPGAKTLIQAGVPINVAHEWAKIRNQMNPSGLMRKLKAQVN